MTRTNTQQDLFPEAPRPSHSPSPMPTFSSPYYAGDLWQDELDEMQQWGMTSEDVNPNEGSK